ncbi:MAG: hypothetical protein JL50_10615 [Peptococcaceae bacterium BICA1-7]|nr:MAG: hypothetical protein JL50_10615 [Peptococcaceae bacterium BICA1-7]
MSKTFINNKLNKSYKISNLPKKKVSGKMTNTQSTSFHYSPYSIRRIVKSFKTFTEPKKAALSGGAVLTDGGIQNSEARIQNEHAFLTAI